MVLYHSVVVNIEENHAWKALSTVPGLWDEELSKYGLLSLLLLYH